MKFGRFEVNEEGFIDLRKNPPATTVTVQGFAPEQEQEQVVTVPVDAPMVAPATAIELEKKPLPAIQKNAEGLQQSVAGPVRVRLKNGGVRFRKTRGKEVGRIVAVDMPECYAIVSLNQVRRLGKHKYFGSQTGHLYRKVKNKLTGQEEPRWLHREIKRCPDDKFVAFLSGDQRDCTPRNLRIVNSKEEVKAIRRAALGKAANG